MRRCLALLIGIAVLTSAAHAASGSGAFSGASTDVLGASHARSLAAISDDAVRFSSSPALGGLGWIVELHKTPKGAQGEALFFDGHPSLGWRRIGWLRLAASDANYARLVARIDELLGRGDPEAAGPLVICTDGPGYLTERRLNGKTTRLGGFCGDHPNNEIASIMEGVIARFGPLPGRTTSDLSADGH
ncbi:MAG TPA: hypothetical protein VG939_18130 [Caulobacteraceae bacterium]|nr:hypothetical protein [Caulobacteraceae bacterium]